jgi:hypothetical protein
LGARLYNGSQKATKQRTKSTRRASFQRARDGFIPTRVEGPCTLESSLFDRAERPFHHQAEIRNELFAGSSAKSRISRENKQIFMTCYNPSNVFESLESLLYLSAPSASCAASVQELNFQSGRLKAIEAIQMGRTWLSHPVGQSDLFRRGHNEGESTRVWPPLTQGTIIGTEHV